MTLNGLKAFFGDASVAMAILDSRGLLKWIPDSVYLKIVYRLKMKKKLDLKNPKTFNEKLQWLKLYDQKPEYTQMVDKYEAKWYVADCIGNEYVVPCYGVWGSFDEIPFDELPNQFVLKCTHDSGGLVICRDKDRLDKAAAKQKIEKSLKRNYYCGSREWPYKNVKPRIIAEQYFEDENEQAGLRDYKFFCFNNEPRFVYLSEGLENHETAKISFYDLEGKQMPFHRTDYRPMAEGTVFPDTMKKMEQVARKLAACVDAPFVRIDLYSVSGHIYFSEITFYPCSGYLPIEPENWNEILGSWIEVPEKKI